MSKIIGFVGFAGSGKDTAANFLLGHGYYKESFAKAVKDAVAKIFSWDRDMLEGVTQFSREWREKPDIYWSNKFGKDFSPRQALQLMGTEVGRDIFHPNLWVDALERRLDPRKNYVISDVRFANEIDKIVSLGGLVVRVRRGPDPVWYDEAVAFNTTPAADFYQFPGLAKVHPSEWKWCGNPKIKYIIENDGTLKDLVEKVLLLTQTPV